MKMVLRENNNRLVARAKEPVAAKPIIARALASIFAPDEYLTPSQWAARYLIVPDGPYAGDKFNLTLAPYLVEPLDAFADDVACNKIVIRKSAQTGFTLLAIAAIGHMIDREPCRMMVVQPTDGALSEFNREKLQPAIEQTEPLTTRVRPQTSRSAYGSTQYSKRYPGGSLTLAIATSTADLRSRTVKKVIKDEASEYPADLDGQGSPHAMISARYESFLATEDWKELNISTPVIKGDCFIDAEFEAGDQRYWHVPCPKCKSEFVFTFGQQFRYSSEFPHEAYYLTPCCGTVIKHYQKNVLVRRGRWIATNEAPGRHRSYHFDAMSSPFVPWDVIAARFIEAKDDATKLKSFDNLTLGLPHEVRGDAPDHVRLMALRESYERGRIPPAGLLLTAAADVQANAIYVEVVAYGADKQTWVVEALVLDGDTDDPDGGAFKKLTRVYEMLWPDHYGHTRPVDALGVDSGFRANVVYAWCRQRPGTFALKGGDGWSRPAISTPSLVDVDIAGRRIKQGAAVWTVGTWSLKAQLYAALRKQRQVEGADEEPPGACHFGMWLEENYFTQLVSEYLADEKFKGRLRRVWKERGANHFLDCRIYNNALADYLGLNRMTPREWQSLARLRGVPDRPAAAPAASSSAQPTPAPAPKRPEPAPPRASRSSFMDSF
jgi:phage terminase large subunit GpA-like protein